MWEPGIKIRTIDDVEPFLTEGIVIKNRGRYISVDYNFISEKTFSNAVATECRGLKFSDGKLIARPFQKFFNIGEKQSPDEIDWCEPHTVYEKLDGSMVHGCILDGNLVFMTRGGISAQSEMAFDRSSNGVHRLAMEAAKIGATAIFEFTSPDNRIVVPYDKDSMTLLAIRDNLTGEYLDHVDFSTSFDVQTAASRGCVGDASEFVAAARALVGQEGYVIAFKNGHRLKIKGEDYAFRHKALATIASEKNVLRLILDGQLDDVAPLLPKPIADRAQALAISIDEKCRSIAADSQSFCEMHGNKSRNEYAAIVRESFNPQISGVAFAVLDGKDPNEFARAILRKSTRSQAKLDTVRNIFGVSWSIDDIPTHEIRG